MHASSQCVFTHVPNVMPRDVIVRAVNVLVILVAIINEFTILKKCDRHTDTQTDTQETSGYRVALQLKMSRPVIEAIRCSD